MTNKNYELNEKELDQVMGGTGVYSILPQADGTSVVIGASSEVSKDELIKLVQDMDNPAAKQTVDEVLCSEPIPKEALSNYLAALEKRGFTKKI